MRDLVAPLVIAMTIAFPVLGADSEQPAVSEAKRQTQSADSPGVIVKMQYLVFADGTIAQLRKLQGVPFPQLWSHAVITQQQAKSLTKACQSDRRVSAGPLPTLRFRDGEPQALSVLGPLHGDTIQATVRDGGRAIELRLLWGTRDDGTQRLPSARVELPAGSDLLVHVQRLAEGRQNSSRWQRLLDQFNANPQPRVEYSEGFLLLSPRMASGESDQDGTAAE